MKIESEAEIYVAGKLLQGAVKEALAGDQSFADYAIRILLSRLATSKPLYKFEKQFLIVILASVVQCPAALNLICQTENKRGTAKKGAKAKRLATDVHMALFHAKQLGRKMSVETAWDEVAQSKNVSVSAVKKAWIEWKDRVKKELTRPAPDDMGIAKYGY